MDNQATVAVSIQACRHFRRHTQKNQENLFLQIYFRVYSYHEISGTNPQFFEIYTFAIRRARRRAYGDLSGDKHRQMHAK